MTSEAPITTRVGGGISARAAGVVIAGALAVIVGIAFLNRPPAPRTEPLALVPPTSAPSQASVSPAASPSRSNDPLQLEFYRHIVFQFDAFAVIGEIGGRQYPIPLEDQGTGTLIGVARLPYPREDTTATLQLVQLWTKAPVKNFQSIGTWSMPLDILMPEVRQSGTVLTVGQDAQPRGTNRLVRSGFQLSMRLESRADYAVMFVTVTMANPDVDHHKVYGEDGIFGLPGWPWRANDNAAPSPTPPPTADQPRLVIKWMGRMWPGPGQKLTR